MKTYLSLAAAFVFFVLASCQKPFEENLSTSPNRSGSRVSATSSTDPDFMTEEQWIAEGYNYGRDFSHLHPSIQNVYNNYFSAISNLEATSDDQTDQTMLGLISGAANTARNAAQNLPLGNGLTLADRDKVVEVFQGTSNHTWWAYNEVINHSSSWGSSTTSFGQDFSPEFESQFSFLKRGKKFWRAVLRVAVAIAVSAVIVAVPIAALGAAKAVGTGFGGFLMGTVKGTGSLLVKGFTLGSFEVSSAILTGAAVGMKNAEKNWDKPWQGMVEFMFGYKLKPIYY